MNKLKIRNYQIFSVIFTFILGVLLHFTYELSGENYIVRIFSSINESVWEHLKLLYFPMLITIVLGFFYFGKEYPNFICAKTIGILSAIFFTVIFFYTYSGILGKTITIIDIISFFVATIIGEALAYILIVNKFKCKTPISILILLILFICFAIFAYFTPDIGLFRDPEANKESVLNCTDSFYIF